MGLFGNRSDADAWKDREDKLQDKVAKLDDEKGQGHPSARAAYRELEKHHEDKPLRLWGRS